jgi:hypothetical protein
MFAKSCVSSVTFEGYLMRFHENIFLDFLVTFVLPVYKSVLSWKHPSPFSMLQTTIEIFLYYN